jgi:dephospho-CoA kinase
MSKEDAEARIASQIDRQTRLQGADLVVDNSGDEQHLAEEVARIWDALVVLRNEANP